MPIRVLGLVVALRHCAISSGLGQALCRGHHACVSVERALERVFSSDGERLNVRLVDDQVGLVVAHVRAIMKSRSEEHTSELQSHSDLVCRLLLEKKKKNAITKIL